MGVRARPLDESTVRPGVGSAGRRVLTTHRMVWRKPKERDATRARALQALPLNTENVRAGAMSPNDFAVMVMREEVSTAITPEEAAGFRQCVGLG